MNKNVIFTVFKSNDKLSQVIDNQNQTIDKIESKIALQKLAVNKQKELKKSLKELSTQKEEKINLLYIEIEDLNSEEKRLSQEIKDLKEFVDEESKKVSTLQLTADEISQKKDHLKSELRQVEESYSNRLEIKRKNEISLANREKELIELKDSIKDKEQKKFELETSLRYLSEQLELTNSDIEELSTDEKELDNRLQADRKKIEDLNEIIFEKQRNRNLLEVNFTKLKEEILSEENRARECESKISELKNEINSLNDLYSRATQDIAHAVSKRSVLDIEASKLNQDIKEAKNALSLIEGKRASIASEINEKNSEIARISCEVTSQNQEIKRIEEENKIYTESISLLLKEVERIKDVQLKNKEIKLSLLLENKKIKAKIESHKQEILNENKNLEKIESGVEALVETISILHSEMQEYEEKLSEIQARHETQRISLDSLSEDRILCQKELVERQNEFNKTITQIEEDDKKISLLNKEVELSRLEISDLELKISEYLIASKKTSGEKEIVEAKYKAISENLSVQKNKKDRLEQLLADEQLELASLKEKIEIILSQNGDLKKAITDLNETLLGQETKKKELNIDLSKQQALALELESDLTHKKSYLDKQKNDLIIFETMSFELASEIDSLNTSIANKKNEIEEYSRKRDSLVAMYEMNGHKRGNLLEERAKLESRTSVLNDDVNELNKKISAIEQENLELNNSLGIFVKKLSDIEIERANKRLLLNSIEVEALQNKDLFDEYNSRIEKIHRENETIDSQLRQFQLDIEKCKNKIASKEQAYKAIVFRKDKLEEEREAIAVTYKDVLRSVEAIDQKCSNSELEAEKLNTQIVRMNNEIRSFRQKLEAKKISHKNTLESIEKLNSQIEVLKLDTVNYKEKIQELTIVLKNDSREREEKEILVRNLTEKYEVYSLQFDQLDSEVKKINSDLFKLTAEVVKKDELNTTLLNSINRLRGEKESQTLEIDNLSQKNISLSSDLEVLSREQVTVSSEMTEATNAVDRLSKEIKAKESEYSELESKIKFTSEKNTQLNREIKRLRSEIIEVDKSISWNKEQLAHAEIEFQQVTLEHKNALDEYNLSKEEKLNSESRLSELRRSLDVLKSEVSFFETENISLNSGIKNEEVDFASLSLEFNKMLDKKSHLIDLNKSLKENNEKVQARLSKDSEKLKVLENEVEKQKLMTKHLEKSKKYLEAECLNVSRDLESLLLEQQSLKEKEVQLNERIQALRINEMTLKDRVSENQEQVASRKKRVEKKIETLNLLDPSSNDGGELLRHAKSAPSLNLQSAEVEGTSLKNLLSEIEMKVGINDFDTEYAMDLQEIPAHFKKGLGYINHSLYHLFSVFEEIKKFQISSMSTYAQITVEGILLDDEFSRGAFKDLVSQFKAIVNEIEFTFEKSNNSITVIFRESKKLEKVKS